MNERQQRRVRASIEVLGHPFAEQRPVSEGEHSEVVAYTDYADVFVPPMIKWADSRLDTFTDADASKWNRSVARAEVRQR
jgi:hypothetical protein